MFCVFLNQKCFFCHVKGNQVAKSFASGKHTPAIDVDNRLLGALENPGKRFWRMPVNNEAVSRPDWVNGHTPCPKHGLFVFKHVRKF